MIARVIRYPLLFVTLVLLWLVLNQSLSLGQILMGIAVALFAQQGMIALAPDKPKIRFSMAIPQLLWLVILDILRSNVAVAKIILSGRRTKTQAGFISVPLDMRNGYGLAVLSVIITSTPGTLWVQYDAARDLLLVHTLDTLNEEEWVEKVKGEYERRLMEIFE